ncbi:DUF4299 family protein [Corynebacterium sputi]|uniref:DUF4299 family protein n=1 Tax=Corynebacterium sputi TaxID=489915 RepID=UPI0004228276|nr:DUF4299 family protein [Corynebacterium sputi]
MSQTFSLTPPGPHTSLTLWQALAATNEELTAFIVDELPIDADVHGKLLHAPLSTSVITIGNPALSGRGFELSFTNGAYVVREFTPTTTIDWRFVLTFMSDLSAKIGADIVAENGETYTPDSIHRFDFESDIASGIEMLTSLTSNGSVPVLRGLRRNVGLNAELLEAVNRAASPVDQFESTFMRVQTFPAHDAQQSLMQDAQGHIIGAYMLTEGVRTTLPHTPALDFHYEGIDAATFDNWMVYLFVATPEGPELLGALPHAQMLAGLPEEKHSLLDAYSLVIEPLTRAEMLEMCRGR